MENRLKIYNTAKESLGKVMSGDNAVFGCAISVNAVVQKALGSPVGGGASTNRMYECLKNNPRFTPVKLEDALPGDILISPTGYGNGDIPNGHCGVLAFHGILSNDSETGEWHEYWKLPNWVKYYGTMGGYPILFFRAN